MQLLHADTLKVNLIPQEITKQQVFIYADEADLLNIALFGVTAKQWQDNNPGRKGNIRDEATIEQMAVPINLESINALLIEQRIFQGERLKQLNRVAITQMRSLIENSNIKKLQ